MNIRILPWPNIRSQFLSKNPSPTSNYATYEQRQFRTRMSAILLYAVQSRTCSSPTVVCRLPAAPVTDVTERTQSVHPVHRAILYSHVKSLSPTDDGSSCGTKTLNSVDKSNITDSKPHQKGAWSRSRDPFFQFLDSVIFEMGKLSTSIWCADWYWGELVHAWYITAEEDVFTVTRRL